ncbi:hypothetical protein JOF35_003810 [Streptomyces demainii]|uniref:Transmembrane protein n=1 Tax=Streptomyces demainii TaxID=588122 RepID=A0ABT9KSX5_9ACTN|nr:hypothetical protein [Streptomyces demainii]
MVQFEARLPLWLLLLLLLVVGVPLTVGWVYAIRCVTRWVNQLPRRVRSWMRRKLLRVLLTDRGPLSDGDNAPRR